MPQKLAVKTPGWCSPRIVQAGCQRDRLPVAIPVRKPDVQTYSQLDAISRGEQPTWDSPDIWTYRWRKGADRKVWGDHKIEALIYNRSMLGTAFGVIVHCDVSSFGLGTPRTRISSKVVNIQRNRSIQLRFPLPDGLVEAEDFFGAHIKAVLPGDINPGNNSGSQVFSASLSSEGRSKTIPFPIHNRLTRTATFEIEALPNDLSAKLSDTQVTLAPGQQVPAELSVTAPDVHGGPNNFIRASVNVVCKENGNVLDGFNYTIFIDD